MPPPQRRTMPPLVLRTEHSLLREPVSGLFSILVGGSSHSDIATPLNTLLT